MKKRTIILFLLIIVLVVGCGLGIYAYQKNVLTTDTVLAYLERQKNIFLSEEQWSTWKYDEETERISTVHLGYEPALEQIITSIPQAAAVQQVNTIPELDPPFVYIGDQMRGNNEKLYYSQGRHILEITLNDRDSLLLLLTLTENGRVYPRVREAYGEGVIRQIQSEINYGDKDIVEFVNGNFFHLSIRTQETAEVLFHCIRNCKHISDITHKMLKPMNTPITAGNGGGDVNWFATTYQETGQQIFFSFEDEDAQALYEYIMSLQPTEG